MTPSEALAKHGTKAAAARAMGLPWSTYNNRLRSERKRAPTIAAPAVHVRPSGPILPAFDDDDIPVAEILHHKRKHFARIEASVASETWFPVRVPDEGAFGVLWFGDPHLDDDACNLPLLERHIDLCRTVPGLYGVNIGDVTNNWTGRLFKKYADQTTTVKRARRLAEWFMHDSGVTWLLWLLGNHDEWEHGGEILRRIAAQRVPILDWEARFRLVNARGLEVRVHAAHDFKGHSQWNIVHGPAKAGMMTTDADLMICGHKHDWGVSQFELAGRGRVVTAARVRGYKWVDEYAVRNGFQSARSGASIMTVVNPAASDPTGRVMTFADPTTGAEVLRALRATTH